MDEIKIQFHGFHPSQFTEGFLKDKFESLLDECPYGATIKPSLHRHDDEFKCHVTINSAAGRFFAVAHGPKMKEVVNKCVQQIRRQIQKWRTQRFKHESLGEVFHEESDVAINN